MHTFKGKNVVILHNGDYSGEVIIRKDNNEITCECEDVFNFVADAVRSKRIGDLEQMDYKKILDI